MTKHKLIICFILGHDGEPIKLKDFKRIDWFSFWQWENKCNRCGKTYADKDLTTLDGVKLKDFELRKSVFEKRKELKKLERIRDGYDQT